MKEDKDSAHVPVPPPLFLLLSIFIGMAFQNILTLQFIAAPLRYWIGGILVTFSIGVNIYCAWLFRKEHTAIEPWKTTSKIMTSGPYHWSRNPMYFCFLVFGIGMGILLNNFWIIMMQFLLFWVLKIVVIQREEKYLEHKFPKKYPTYKHNVRRWI